MARQFDRLTDRAIRALKGKGYHGDGGGLYLQVSATGGKSWIFRFKVGGKARDMGLGPYPTVSLADARQKAQEARQHRLGGKDPLAEKAAVAAAERLTEARSTTFRQCAEMLLASNEDGWRSAKHRQQWRNTLAAYCYPVLGDLPVADITTDLVLKVIEPIWKTKTETASRVRGRIERVLAYAKVREFRTGENPAVWRGHLAQILPARPKIAPVEHHSALHYRDVPAFLARLRARQGVTPLCLEFTILTAVRTGEALGATFAEIDLDAAMWTIPAKRMKAGKEHRVPLCDRALAIVKEMTGERRSQYVFNGLKSGEPLCGDAMLGMLEKLHAGITVHGFRSSFRDWAGEETNTPHDVCEAALAHTRKDKAHAAYQRGDLFEKRRQLMNAWAAFIEPSAPMAAAVRRTRAKATA